MGSVRGEKDCIMSVRIRWECITIRMIKIVLLSR